MFLGGWRLKLMVDSQCRHRARAIRSAKFNFSGCGPLDVRDQGARRNHQPPPCYQEAVCDCKKQAHFLRVSYWPMAVTLLCRCRLLLEEVYVRDLLQLGSINRKTLHELCCFAGRVVASLVVPQYHFKFEEGT
jgi:hypothetical protein